MSRFPNYLRRQLAQDDENNIRRAVGAETEQPTTNTRHYVPTATDSIRLRGIPAIGPGVTGAIRGSRPEDAIR